MPPREEEIKAHAVDMAPQIHMSNGYCRNRGEDVETGNVSARLYTRPERWPECLSYAG
jgi:hypothetical protein